MTPTSRRKAETLAAAGLCLLMAAAYLLHPVRLSEAREVTNRFWRPLRSAGLSLDGGHIPRALREGVFTDWTHLAAREATAHYHPNDPEAWERLMERWQSGAWTPPDPVNLRNALETVDRRWRVARAQAPPLDATAAELIEAGWQVEVWPEENARRVTRDGGLELRFAENHVGEVIVMLSAPAIPAAHLGDVPVLKAEGLAAPPRLFFETSQMPISGNRVVNATEAEHESWQFDLSVEPAWRAPGVIVQRLRLNVVPEGDVIILKGLAAGDAD